VFWVDIYWWVQKNGQYNETISFWQDNIANHWCSVWWPGAFACELATQTSPSWSHWGKYLNHTRHPLVFINTVDVEALMCDMAQTITGVTDNNIINNMFSLHSLHVRACNELSWLGVAESCV
jgi:hypothetical protein